MRIHRSAKILGLIFLILASAALVPGLILAQDNGYQPPHDKPGPAVDTLWFGAFDVDIAPLELEAGSMDFYGFSLKTDAAQKLRGTSGVRLYEAPATMLSLILNPAPAPEGELNPFSIREVRFALQYVVNRQAIAQEVFKGLAKPMVTHVTPFDYDYLAIADALTEFDIQYDPELAKQMVTEAMTKAGAELVDDVWHYNGRPILVKFIIRTEDGRRTIGDMVRAELDKLGFQVAAVYHQFAPALLRVYGTDPQLFEWHLYTEGWGRGSAERYDYSTLNQMAAPWLGNMPGWQEVGYWQYENAQLDDVGQRIFRGDFQDRAARDELYRQATLAALEESVRIWLVSEINTFPSDDSIVGVTEDVVAGPKALSTLREAYIPGQDTLTVGSLWVWTARTIWNPIGGMGDVYSVDIWRNIHDPPLIRHPFTGVPIPFRATYEVRTAGPAGKLDVPPDAVMWDARAGAWASVGQGVKATSVATLDYSKYTQSNWHHGQPITMADVIYSIAQSFERTYDENKSQIEVALATTARPYLDTFRGFRILDDNRLEVYVDYWHFEPDYIAEYASPASLSMPWEILAAMDDVVYEQRRAAYSDTAAQRFGLPWLSLVQDRDARLVETTLRQFQEQETFPQGVFQVGERSLVSREEAMARYAAARKWFAEAECGPAGRKCLVISNGPFKLAWFDPPAQSARLEAVRDETYPFKPGDWYFGEPPQLSLSPMGEDRIFLGRETNLQVELTGPGVLGLQYALLDPATGRTVKSGEASPSGEGQFAISLSEQETTALAPGLYHLNLRAFSDRLSSVAERTVDLEATTATPESSTPSTPGDGQTPTEGSSPSGCSLGSATGDIGLLAFTLLGLMAFGKRRRRR